MIRRGETAYLAEVLQTAVHLLVGHIWKRPSAREILILVLVQTILFIEVQPGALEEVGEQGDESTAGDVGKE